MLRRKFRHKLEEIAGRWRGLHSEELNGFFFPRRYYNDEEVMEDEIGGCETCMREMKNVYGIFVWNICLFSPRN